MSEKRSRKNVFMKTVRNLKSEQNPFYNSLAVVEPRSKAGEMRREPVQKPNKPNDFLKYNDSSSDEETLDIKENISNTSYNVCDYVSSRESGLNELRSVNFEQAKRYLLTHNMLRETQINLGHIDKVFCSKWLSDRQVVFGTKCNKLLLYDVNMKRLNTIPIISNNRKDYTNPSIFQGGIHALDINPSRTFLATGALNSANVAVYNLPNVDPMCVGESGHLDSIMDMCWLDDQFLISGSKDSSLSLWSIMKADFVSFTDSMSTTINLLCSTDCITGQGIRSLCFNKEYKEIAALSFNGFIHIFNAETFRQKLSRKLPYCPETISIAYHKDGNYAIGCRLYILLIDARTLQTIKKITTRYNGCGIRAISFHHNLLTIGTGLGMLLFYDIRARKYLESSENSSGIVSLKCSKGTVYSEDEMNGFEESKYVPTIYTHCYDRTGLRLFAAGGPLPSTLVGSYAGIWQ